MQVKNSILKELNQKDDFLTNQEIQVMLAFQSLVESSLTNCFLINSMKPIQLDPLFQMEFHLLIDCLRDQCFLKAIYHS
ncbi:hypothetical protein Lal_00028607 [Lupinus albus]|nr:hypothetical protein Lal_00028607 [Lupinus albus]